ncbi:uncharacterized protein LOC124678881 isoform X2 [Lolium rigidum]|uniref:uncharacterized protein LOC124678881 isoform X2 n=1 Tax=Lolium rigidum TaxID=89674 RepID=UPI001F5C8E18|nr:uncharacterized protein LOC124678881 isoform X2 [Lolium rigidum]
MGRPNRNHLLADLRVGWPELSDTPHANRFPLRIKSDIEWWMCLLLDAHIALGQLVFCFCFYIGSYTNVVQRLGKATSDERLLGLAKRAVLRSGYLIMESFISGLPPSSGGWRACTSSVWSHLALAIHDYFSLPDLVDDLGVKKE